MPRSGTDRPSPSGGRCQLPSRGRRLTDEGEKGTETISVNQTIFDGTYDVPCYLIEPVAVTAEHLDEVSIDSGSHRREVVYLNISREPAT